MRTSNFRLATGLVTAALLSLCAAARAANAAAEGTNAFRFVDLSPYAAAAEASVRQFSALPSGRQVFHGIPFEIRGRIAVTGLDSARFGEFFPPQINGIPIGTAA